MKKIAADRNYNLKKKAFSGAEVWSMGFVDYDGDANPEYTLGLFSSKESAMNSLDEVFKFAKEKGLEVTIERDNESRVDFYIGNFGYYLIKSPLMDGQKFKPKDFHLYEDSEPITYDEEDLYQP